MSVLEAKFLYAFAFILILTVYHVILNRRLFFISPLTVFIYFHSIQFLGTLLHSNPEVRQFDFTRLANMLVGVFVLVVGAAVAIRYSRFEIKEELHRFRDRKLIHDIKGSVYLLAIITGIISIIVGIIYVIALGYNAVLALIEAFSASGDLGQTAIVYGTLRTALGSDIGVRYVAPGYAAQFTTVLLPLSFYLIFVRSARTKSLLDRTISIAYLLFCIYFMSITGVRGYLLAFALVFLIICAKRIGPFASSPPIRNRYLLGITLLLTIWFYSLFTILGRTGDSGRPNIMTPATDFVNRVVFVSVDNQLRAMDYLHNRAFGLGRGWLESLTNVLPRGGIRESAQSFFDISGEDGSDISMKIYRELYGGYGSAPLDIWSSTWLEFGWFGIVIVSFVIGYLFQRITIWQIRNQPMVTKAVIVTMLTFSLMMLSEPSTFFLGGSFTLAAYFQVTKIVKSWDKRHSVMIFKSPTANQRTYF